MLVQFGADVVVGDPIIPSIGGVVVQTNVTGVAQGITALTNNKFAIGGATKSLQLQGTDLYLTPVDGLLAKYSSGGSNEWVRTPNFGMHDVLHDVVADSSDNLYASGYTYTDGGNFWGRVLKYDSSGSEVWSLNVTVSGTDNTMLTGIALDGTTLTITGAVRNVVQGVNKVYPLIAQVSTSGSLLSAVYMNDPSYLGHIWFDIAKTDSSSEWFVAGWASASVDGTFARVDSDSVIWDKVVQSSRWNSVAHDGALPIGAGLTKETGTSTKYFFNTTKYESDGDLTWTRKYDTTPLLPVYEAHAVVTDSSGNSFVSGRNATLVQNPGENPLNFLVTYILKGGVAHRVHTNKYEPDGDLAWSVSYGETLRDFEPLANTLDSEPRLLIAGFKADLAAVTAHPAVIRYEQI